MDTAVIDFGTRKTAHLHYVGLSRLRNLNGLYITCFSEHKIHVNPLVVQKMERLRHIHVWHPCLPDLATLSG